MNEENRNALSKLLDEHKRLGISRQIDYDIQTLIDTREQDDISIFIEYMARLHCQHLKKDIDQYMTSMNGKPIDKFEIKKEMVDKWSIKPTLADKLADIMAYMADKKESTTEMVVKEFGYPETSAKRYLRQLTEFGYLEAHGGNRNRTYSKSR